MPSFNGLEYEVRGAGQPIVFLHAGISDMGMWDDQTAYFSGQYQVIRYDLRGYGKSPITSGEFSHVEDLDALLTHLNLASVVLVGCSIGGTTVLDYTLAHPDKVKALVLVGADPSGYEIQGEPPQALLNMQEALQSQNMPDALEYGAQLWVDGEGRTADQVDAALRNRVKQSLLIVFQNYGVGTNKPPAVLAVNHLADVHVPALIIVGKEDHPGLHSAAELMAAGIAGARLVVIEDTAHVPSMEKPAEFNRIVAEFLTAL